MYRNLRALLALRQMPLHARAFLKRYGDQYDVRTARVKKPWLFHRKRIMTVTVHTLTAYMLLRLMLKQVPEEWLIDEEEAEDKSTAQRDKPDYLDLDQLEDEEDMPSWFIPLWWPQQAGREPFHEESPEFQAFVVFSRDNERKEAVLEATEKLMLNACERDRRYTGTIGAPLRISRSWLDIDYPLYAPPGWVRTGIEITDDYVALVDKSMETAAYIRLQNALWPSALFASALGSLQTLIDVQSERISRNLGLDGPGGTDDMVKHSRQSQESEPKPDDRVKVVVADKPYLFTVLEDVHQDLSKQLAEDVSPAVRAFRTTFQKLWRPSIRPPSRGALWILGTVEVAGSKGTCVCEIKMAFNPTTNAFELMSIRPKLVLMYNQGPADH